MYDVRRPAATAPGSPAGLNDWEENDAVQNFISTERWLETVHRDLTSP